MNNFVPRTTTPGVNIKYYRHTGYYVDGINGVNEAIIIDGTTGYVMPNCVGYTWGRAYEAYGRRTNLPALKNAEEWYANTQDGYQRGRRARLGSIICFDGGILTGGGHVAMVEQIYDDGDILTSNSAYDGTLFWTERVSYNSGTGEYVRPGGLSILYTFQGFIYLDSGNLPVWLLKKIADNKTRW